MKYILVLLAFVLVIGGCSSSKKTKTTDGSLTTYTMYQGNYIVDQEFDLLVAPEYDYQTQIKYEDQIKNNRSATKGTAAAKPAKKPVARKAN